MGLFTIFVGVTQKDHKPRWTVRVASRSCFTFVYLDVCGIPVPVSGSYLLMGAGSTITAYGHLSPRPSDYSCRMHLSTWLTFNMCIFTLCEFSSACLV